MLLSYSDLSAAWEAFVHARGGHRVLAQLDSVDLPHFEPEEPATAPEATPFHVSG